MHVNIPGGTFTMNSAAACTALLQFVCPPQLVCVHCFRLSLSDTYSYNVVSSHIW